MVGISTISSVLLFLGLTNPTAKQSPIFDQNVQEVFCACDKNMTHPGYKGDLKMPDYCKKNMNISVLIDCVHVLDRELRGEKTLDESIHELFKIFNKNKCDGINNIANCHMSDAKVLGVTENDLKVSSDIPVKLNGRGREIYAYPKKGIFFFMGGSSRAAYSFKFDLIYSPYDYYRPNFDNCTYKSISIGNRLSRISYKCRRQGPIKLGDFSYEPGDVINKNCKNEESFTMIREITLGRGNDQHNYEEAYLICVNGTIRKMHQTIFRIDGCSTVFVSQLFVRCTADSNLDHCSITEEFIEEKHLVKIDTKKAGTVLINKDGKTHKIECDYHCEIELDAEKSASVTCPNGYSRTFETHIIENDCPFISLWSTGVVAGYICKATGRPILFWVLLSFIVLGKYAFGLLYLLVDYLIYITTKAIIKIRKRMKFEVTLCECCDEEICYRSLETRHKTCCNGVCPYCRRFVEELKSHSKLCTDKIIIVNDAEAKEKRVGKLHRFIRSAPKRSHIGSSIGTLLNIVFCMVLLFVMISPSHGYMNQWDREKEALELCYSGCFHDENSCICEKNGDMIQNEEQKDGKKYGTPDELPKGFIGVKGHLKPGYSSRNIDLTFSTAYEDEDKIHIKGNSIVNIQLETFTGASWNIRNPHSDQKGVYSVAVIDFRQIYKTKFAFWTTDRFVKSGSNNVCTGTCDKNCNCESKTCKILHQENIRSWSCNPSWCWNIGGGCSCCFLKAETKDINYVIGAFDTEYIDTEIYLCLKHELKEYECRIVKENEVLESGEVSVKISKTFGINKKLPKRIYVEFIKENNKFDFTHIDNIFFTNEICSESSCTHGEVGDYKFYELNGISSEGNVEMSWTDVTQNLECESFHWPNCRNSDVVVQNTDRFKNVIDRSEHIGEEFSHREGFISGLLGDKPVLEINTRPKKGGGNIELFLQINDLVLKKREVKVEIGNFEIKACSGCYSCQEGISCSLKILANSNEQLNIHFYSPIDHVLTESDTTNIGKGTKKFNLTLYSPIKLDVIEICIEETKQCARTENINIAFPKNKLTSKHQVINVSEKDEGGFSLKNLSNNFINFFSNLYSGLMSLLSVKNLIILAVIVIVCVVVYILYKILFSKKIKKDFSKQV